MLGCAANDLGRQYHCVKDLGESARQEAFELLLQRACEHGANAVTGLRYQAAEVLQGVAEVLAYGTAVHVERVS